MRDTVDDIRARGAELHAIGNGSLDQAQTFARDQELDFDLYVDPALRAYRAAGLSRGVGATLSPRVVGNALRSFRRGFRQGRTQGDPWQLGGSFIITPSGVTLLAHRSRVAGDHVAPEAILRALGSLGS